MIITVCLHPSIDIYKDSIDDYHIDETSSDVSSFPYIRSYIYGGKGYNVFKDLSFQSKLNEYNEENHLIVREKDIPLFINNFNIESFLEDKIDTFKESEVTSDSLKVSFDRNKHYYSNTNSNVCFIRNTEGSCEDINLQVPIFKVKDLYDIEKVRSKLDDSNLIPPTRRNLKVKIKDNTSNLQELNSKGSEVTEYQLDQIIDTINRIIDQKAGTVTSVSSSDEDGGGHIDPVFINFCGRDKDCCYIKIIEKVLNRYKNSNKVRIFITLDTSKQSLLDCLFNNISYPYNPFFFIKINKEEIEEGIKLKSDKEEIDDFINDGRFQTVAISDGPNDVKVYKKGSKGFKTFKVEEIKVPGDPMIGLGDRLLSYMVKNVIDIMKTEKIEIPNNETVEKSLSISLKEISRFITNYRKLMLKVKE